MAAFEDSLDPELGAACDRLAAWVEPLPEGHVIDPASCLTERDLALILRRLYDMRKSGPMPSVDMQAPADSDSRPSVPLTRKGPWR